MKVLIAEDDPVSRMLLRRTLEKWGHDVRSTSWVRRYPLTACRLWRQRPCILKHAPEHFEDATVIVHHRIRWHFQYPTLRGPWWSGLSE